jgi:hypothetical protein
MVEESYAALAGLVAMAGLQVILIDGVIKRTGICAERIDVAKIIKLPGNFIGPVDREKLESFGGHTIAHGRATRWRWDKNAKGDDVFEIHTGGPDAALAVCIDRDRKLDQYVAHDAAGYTIVSGALDHVFAELDGYLARLHGERPDTPA